MVVYMTHRIYQEIVDGNTALVGKFQYFLIYMIIVSVTCNLH